MFILIRLNRHASSIIMLIVRRTDYIKNVTVIIGFILLVVKILYLIDWVVLYSSLLG